ncbi:MAG: hypothetical protein Q8Q59_04805 [Luteolibacter sp.]|nr:hypothetical protein [Luteolibacter sp.]
MKLGIALISLALILPATAEIKRKERRSLLDSDPGVVYMARSFDKPIELKVVKEAPVFSDKEGKHRLGSLKADQVVHLEAITDKIYRVRGQGTRDGIAGWVAPWAFSSQDPQFVAHLKEFYERQIQVQALIDAKQVAVGMTLDEVSQSRGKPNKTSLRKTEKGQSGRWEYIEYEEINHYITRVNPVTGVAYRQFSHTTQVEKGRTTVEFEDNIVTAVEESEDRQGGSVRIVVPPLLYRW